VRPTRSTSRATCMPHEPGMGIYWDRSFFRQHGLTFG